MKSIHTPGTGSITTWYPVPYHNVLTVHANKILQPMSPGFIFHTGRPIGIPTIFKLKCRSSLRRILAFAPAFLHSPYR
jgi:hypothetical protein